MLVRIATSQSHLHYVQRLCLAYDVFIIVDGHVMSSLIRFSITQRTAFIAPVSDRYVEQLGPMLRPKWLFETRILNTSEETSVGIKEGRVVLLFVPLDDDRRFLHFTKHSREHSDKSCRFRPQNFRYRRNFQSSRSRYPAFPQRCCSPRL